MARSWTSTRRPEAAGRREPVFSTKGEAAIERAPPAHHGVEALVSSAAARGAACGAACGVTLDAACGATVYTNAPERRREAVFGDLCTLLCPHPAARAGLASQLAPQQCTQMAQNGSERPFSAICVHYCVTTGRPRESRVATVYTNGPEQLRETAFGDLCTLLCPPASPGGARATPVSQQCTQMPRNGSVRPFSAICVHYCVLASVHNSTTVYTNAPKRRGEAQSSHLCTLLRSQGHSQPKLTAQQCTQMPQNGAERPFPPICVHSCVVALAVRPTPSGR